VVRWRAVERVRELWPANLEALRASLTWVTALRRFILNQFVLGNVIEEVKFISNL
jgi:hypothetical protein